MQYGDIAPVGSIPKVYGISVAHSNSSAIEAWFSVARMLGLDSTTKYESLVGNKDMLRATQADIALENNRMYSGGNVGEVSAGKFLGPSELVEYHQMREKKMIADIEKHYDSITYQVNQATPAFSSKVGSMIVTSLRSYEMDALLRLSSKKLPKGYLYELLHNDYFRQWMRLSFDTSTESWFDTLLNDTLDGSILLQIDEACQVMTCKMFEMTVTAMKKRNNDQHSFEYDLHELHRSTKFTTICKKYLPAQLADNHPCCVFMYLSLARMHTSWLKEALVESRKVRSPELFSKKAVNDLTGVELNSEVNRFLGWAIFSSTKRIKTDLAIDVECRKVLKAMMMRERQADDVYMSKYYDANMAMANRGGLTLVNSNFFEFGKSFLSTVRGAFNEDMITQDPHHAFENAKTHVMNNQSLRSYFLALCKKHSVGDLTACEHVYTTVVRKTIHARFSVVYRHWKEANVKRNGQVAFRTQLKAQSGKSSPDKKAKTDSAATTKSPKKRLVDITNFPLATDQAAINRKKRKDHLKQKRDNIKRLKITAASMK
jgi:hypothetical protein